MTPTHHQGPDHAARALLHSGVRISIDNLDVAEEWELLWCLTIIGGHLSGMVALAVGESLASYEGVDIYSTSDDQGRVWYAVTHAARKVRSLHLDERAAFEAARHFADVFPPVGGWSERSEFVLADFFHLPLAPDLVDEYGDPMEEPGASVCAECGLYPLRTQEPHECPAWLSLEPSV